MPVRDNEQVGPSGSFGLVMIRRTKTSLDKSCMAFTELEIPDDAADTVMTTTSNSAISSP
jgi:hypothetical protein